MQALLRIITTMALVGFSLTALGCGAKVAEIGAVLPLTGEYQSYGEASRKGLELAYEELLSGPTPPPMHLTIVDSGSQPETASQLLDDLYAQGAHAAIGAVTSAEAAAMVRVADDYDRVLLSPSATDPQLTRDSRNFYSIATPDDRASSTMATFAAGRLGVKKVVVVSDESVSSAALDAFRSSIELQRGHIISDYSLGEFTTSGGEADLAALAKKVRSQRPDAVFLVGYEDELGTLIQELRKSRFRGNILTTHAIAPALKRLGRHATGVLLTHTVYSEERAGFVERYRAKYGEAPDVFAAEGYDVMMVLAAALKDRPIHPNEIRKGLRDGVKGFVGATGEIQFTDKGGIGRYPRVFSVAKDLTLQDHGKELDVKQERIRIEKARLEKRLSAVRQNAVVSSAG
jgi:branched-chain amino acid transport system substrate-binding protein